MKIFANLPKVKHKHRICRMVVLVFIGAFYIVEARWAWHDALMLIALGHFVEAFLEMLSEEDHPSQIII